MRLTRLRSSRGLRIQGYPVDIQLRIILNHLQMRFLSCKIEITVESLMSETVELGAEKVEMNNSRKQLFEKGSRSN